MRRSGEADASKPFRLPAEAFPHTHAPPVPGCSARLDERTGVHRTPTPTGRVALVACVPTENWCPQDTHAHRTCSASRLCSPTGRTGSHPPAAWIRPLPARPASQRWRPSGRVPSSRFTSCLHTVFAPTASEEQLSMPDRPSDPELPNAQHECLVLAAGLLRGVTDRGCHTDGFAVRKLRAHSRIVLSCEYVPNAYRFPDCVALHETKFVPRNNVRSPVHSVLHLWLPKRTPSKGPRA